MTTERNESRFEMNPAVVFVPRMSQLPEQGSVGKQTWPYKADEWADKDKSLFEMNLDVALLVVSLERLCFNASPACDGI